MSDSVKQLLSVIVLTCSGLIPLTASGFGKLGHRLAGEVAAPLLCERAAAELKKLNEPYSFVSAGAWADKVRYQDEWRQSRSWHYINVETDTFDPAAARNPDGDVLWAIAYFQPRITDRSLSDQQRLEAMLFLVHFVVDIHQPLHVGYAADLGGNKVKVQVDGRKTNLHALWDTGLLQLEGQSRQDYVAALRSLTSGRIDEWQTAEPEDWLIESLGLRPQVYAFRAQPGLQPARLNEAYLIESKEIIDMRLAQAGVRLAGVLNGIWCGDDAPEN